MEHLLSISTAWLAGGGAAIGALLAWLGWRLGPGRRIRALEAWRDETTKDLGRLRRQVRKGWGDDDLKTSIRPGEPGPF